MKEIQPIDISGFDNKAHFQFVSDMADKAEADATVSEQCAAQVKELREAVKTESEKLQRSLVTVKIVESDNERDRLYISYTQAVGSYVDFPDADKSAAANILQRHIDEYKIDPKMRLDKETELLIRFIQDLESKHKAQVDTLLLGAFVEKMKVANEKVRELSLQYTDERQDAEALKAARMASDDAYLTLLEHINAHILIEGSANYTAFIVSTFSNSEQEEAKRKMSGKQGMRVIKAKSQKRALRTVLIAIAVVLAVLATAVGILAAFGYMDDIVQGAKILISSVKQSEQISYHSTQISEDTAVAEDSFGYSAYRYENEATASQPKISIFPDYLIVEETTITGYRDNIPTSIFIPRGITKIAKGAFSDCTTLESVRIPGTVEVIGEEIGLEELDGVFDGCTSLKRVIIEDGVQKIGFGAFVGCVSLESVIIPSSVTIIGEIAFMECETLINVTIPDDVTDIGGGAFWGCKSLQDVNISKGVTTIDAFAFRGCESLTSISIPNSVTTIGNGAFLDCASLTRIYFDGTSEQWEKIAENCGLVSGTQLHCTDGNFTIL